ncbi:hypothetical protein CNEO2_670016 [Clostridium neonatale]|nr:hypothetical protein CNEO2_670016 [Clostridium neonatale]
MNFFLGEKNKSKKFNRFFLIKILYPINKLYIAFIITPPCELYRLIIIKREIFVKRIRYTNIDIKN